MYPRLAVSDWKTENHKRRFRDEEKPARRVSSHSPQKNPDRRAFRIPDVKSVFRLRNHTPRSCRSGSRRGLFVLQAKSAA